MNEKAHWLKQRVISHDWLRALLRRRVLAPYQERQLRRVAREIPVTKQLPADAPLVLVLAFRHWAISRAWETVMSRLLLQEGCRVTWLECERALLRCDGMTGETRDLRLCEHCCSFNRNADEVSGVERLSMRDLVGEGDGAWSDDPEQASELERLTEASFQRIRSAGRRRLDELTPVERSIRDDLFTSAAITRRAASRALERLRPTAVLALNGKFFAEKTFLEEAQRRGIGVWTYERGNRRDTVAMAADRPAIPFATDAIIARLENEPLGVEQENRIRSYLNERVELGNGQVRFLPAKLRTVADFGGTRLLALFTNLIWDSSVVGEDTIFGDMFDWIETTIRTAASLPDTRLVIRVHPAEEKVYWHLTRERVEDVLRKRFPTGLPPNVQLVRPSEPLDSYALARAAEVVLVYASSIGMEAAAMGKRVVAAASSSYAAAPFIVRPSDRDAYVEELRSGRSEPASPRAVELAMRFMYRLYFEEMLPVPAVAEDPTGFHAVPAAGTDDSPLRNRLRALLDAALKTADPRTGATADARFDALPTKSEQRPPESVLAPELGRV